MGNFIVKCRYPKVMDSGETKKVSEVYVVDAMTCTEAEARAVEEISPYTQELEVTSVQEKKNVEVFTGENDCFYLAKVAIITIDEITANVKKSVVTWYVNAASFEDAYARVKAEVKKFVTDSEIVSICKTNIVEYYGSKD